MLDEASLKGEIPWKIVSIVVRGGNLERRKTQWKIRIAGMMMSGVSNVDRNPKVANVMFAVAVILIAISTEVRL